MEPTGGAADSSIVAPKGIEPRGNDMEASRQFEQFCRSLSDELDRVLSCSGETSSGRRQSGARDSPGLSCSNRVTSTHAAGQLSVGRATDTVDSSEYLPRFGSESFDHTSNPWRSVGSGSGTTHPWLDLLGTVAAPCTDRVDAGELDVNLNHHAATAAPPEPSGPGGPQMSCEGGGQLLQALLRADVVPTENETGANIDPRAASGPKIATHGTTEVAPAGSSEAVRKLLDWIDSLVGIENVGWTFNERKIHNNQKEYQVVVYYLLLLSSYHSKWFPDTDSALEDGLKACLSSVAEAAGRAGRSTLPNVLNVGPSATPFQLRKQTSGRKLVRQHCSTPAVTTGVQPFSIPTHFALSEMESRACPVIPGVRGSPGCDSSPGTSSGSSNSSVSPRTGGSVFFVWVSYIPESMLPHEMVGAWNAAAGDNGCILDILRLPIYKGSQGLLVVSDMEAAVEAIRVVKMKQLEMFEFLIAYGSSSAALATLLSQWGHSRVLLDPHNKYNAVGLSAVELDPEQGARFQQRLLHSSQLEASSGMRLRRSSVETLRLLLTHPEIVPETRPGSNQFDDFYSGGVRPPTAAAQRRSCFRCELCSSNAGDSVGAWRHVGRAEHQFVRDRLIGACFDFLQRYHPDVLVAAACADSVTPTRPTAAQAPDSGLLPLGRSKLQADNLVRPLLERSLDTETGPQLGSSSSGGGGNSRSSPPAATRSQSHGGAGQGTLADALPSVPLYQHPPKAAFYSPSKDAASLGTLRLSGPESGFGWSQSNVSLFASSVWDNSAVSAVEPCLHSELGPINFGPISLEGIPCLRRVTGDHSSGWW